LGKAFKLKTVMRFDITVSILLCLSALAGCSSNDVGQVTPEFPNYESFDAARSEAATLSGRIDLAGTESGPRPTGAVTYNGLLGISSQSTDFSDPASIAADPLLMAGRLSLTADFSGDGQMSGQAGQFIDFNNNQLEGTLAIAQEFDQSPFAANQFIGTANGNITAANGEVYSIGARLGGNFQGDAAQFVYADGYGDVITSNGLIAYDLSYVAER
jgi:hypothetical protein